MSFIIIIIRRYNNNNIASEHSVITCRKKGAWELNISLFVFTGLLFLMGFPLYAQIELCNYSTKGENVT